MKATKFFLFVMFMSVLPFSRAMACDFCMLGQGINPYLLPTGRGITIDSSYTMSDRIYDHNSPQETQGKKEGWLVYTATGFYAINENLTVSLGVPYAIKTNIDYDDASGSNPGAMVQGLGDVFLTGRYTVFRQHSLDSTLVFGVLGGVKTPTGSTGERALNGTPLDRHVLPGTGSWDWRAGFTGSYAAASGYQFTTDFLYNYAGVGRWAGQKHQYGDSVNWSAKGYARVWKPEDSADKSLFVFTGPVWDWTGREHGTMTDAGYLPDQVNYSSGGSTVFWEVGVYSVFSPSATASLAFAPAVYHDMNLDPNFDADPAESYKVDFSLTYLF